jgi:alkaline phosphatase D
MTATRRTLLAQGLAALGVAIAARPGIAAAPRFASDPFRLGVASGFPTDQSVVLWTRLAPDPLAPDGGMPPLNMELSWEIAADETFRRFVPRAPTPAQAAHAHSARVEVKGLAAARDYWYRFTAGDYRSRIGRTRTLPPPGAHANNLRLAIVNCQHYEHGNYAAYQHIANNPPDLILHLGDYIYEGAPTTGRVRMHAGNLCQTLIDYRQRHALYHLDPALQDAHAAAPWMCIWDDHEVANDYAGTTTGRAESPEVFLPRRMAAYQAYYEHLPLPPAAAPQGGELALYARRRIGDLAVIHLLDQRQYRSPEACPVPGRAGGNVIAGTCADLRDEKRTMLGFKQEAWLEAGLAKEPATWSLLAQGTIMSYLDDDPGEGTHFWSDAWCGYPAARQRLINALQNTHTATPIVLSGDIHAFAVSGINARPEQLDSPLVAAEFVATSLSSDARPQQQFDEWAADNPNFKVFDGRHRGYLSLHITDKILRADLMIVDQPQNPQSGTSVWRSFAVEAGNPQIQPA